MIFLHFDEQQNQMKSGKVTGGSVTKPLKMTKFNLKIVQPDHFTAGFYNDDAVFSINIDIL